MYFWTLKIVHVLFPAKLLVTWVTSVIEVQKSTFGCIEQQNKWELGI